MADLKDKAYLRGLWYSRCHYLIKLKVKPRVIKIFRVGQYFNALAEKFCPRKKIFGQTKIFLTGPFMLL